MSVKIHSYLLDKANSSLPALKTLFETNGPILIPSKRSPDLLSFLAKTVVGQQLSKGAADAIWGRVDTIKITEDISASTLFSGQHNDEIKRCGVSRNKIKALNSLSAIFSKNPEFENGLLDLPNDTITCEIKSIWGLGQWSAEMSLIFYFNREDVWSLDDASLCRGIKTILTDSEISKRDIAEFVSPYCPFRTYLALHIWKGIDSNLL